MSYAKGSVAQASDYNALAGITASAAAHTAPPPTRPPPKRLLVICGELGMVTAAMARLHPLWPTCQSAL